MFFLLVDLVGKEEFKLTTDNTVSKYTLQQQQCLHQVVEEKHFCGDFLSFLPPEIAFSILVYLDVKDLIRGLRVCRKWRQLITEATPAWKAAANKASLLNQLMMVTTSSTRLFFMWDFSLPQCGPSHLLAEELRFSLPEPIYDMLKSVNETDIQEKVGLVWLLRSATVKSVFQLKVA